MMSEVVVGGIPSMNNQATMSAVVVSAPNDREHLLLLRPSENTKVPTQNETHEQSQIKVEQASMGESPASMEMTEGGRTPEPSATPAEITPAAAVSSTEASQISTPTTSHITPNKTATATPQSPSNTTVSSQSMPALVVTPSVAVAVAAPQTNSTSSSSSSVTSGATLTAAEIDQVASSWTVEILQKIPIHLTWPLPDPATVKQINQTLSSSASTQAVLNAATQVSVVPIPMSSKQVAQHALHLYQLLAKWQDDFIHPASALAWLSRARPARTGKITVPPEHRWPKSVHGAGGYMEAFRAIGLTQRMHETKLGHWHWWYWCPKRVCLEAMQLALNRRWRESQLRVFNSGGNPQTTPTPSQPQQQQQQPTYATPMGPSSYLPQQHNHMHPQPQAYDPRHAQAVAAVQQQQNQALMQAHQHQQQQQQSYMMPPPPQQPMNYYQQQPQPMNWYPNSPMPQQPPQLQTQPNYQYPSSQMTQMPPLQQAPTAPMTSSMTSQMPPLQQAPSLPPTPASQLPSSVPQTPTTPQSQQPTPPQPRVERIAARMGVNMNQNAPQDMLEAAQQHALMLQQKQQQQYGLQFAASTPEQQHKQRLAFAPYLKDPLKFETSSVIQPIPVNGYSSFMTQRVPAPVPTSMASVPENSAGTHEWFNHATVATFRGASSAFSLVKTPSSMVSEVHSSTQPTCMPSLPPQFSLSRMSPSWGGYQAGGCMSLGSMGMIGLSEAPTPYYPQPPPSYPSYVNPSMYGMAPTMRV